MRARLAARSAQTAIRFFSLQPRPSTPFPPVLWRAPAYRVGWRSLCDKADATTSGSASATASASTEQPKTDAVSETDALRAQLDEAKAKADELKTRLSEQEAKTRDMQERALRLMAEMENLRTQSRKQMDESKQFAVRNFAKALLEIGDNLSRAQEAVPQVELEKPEPSDLKTLHEGVVLIRKTFDKVMAANGVRVVDPTGLPFNPNEHQALVQIPDGSKPPNSVVQCFKMGYFIHDRVLRAAEVAVAVAPPKPKVPQEESDTPA